jgi:hypothetical protein
MSITPSRRTYRRIELSAASQDGEARAPVTCDDAVYDNPPHAARSLHRVGIDPVSRVGSYRSEMIIRLGLIEITRIKAKA